MKVVLRMFLLFAFLFGACTRFVPTKIPTETVNVPTDNSVPEVIPTFSVNQSVTPASPPSPQLSTFPFAPTLNEALPKDNLTLALHMYADDICYDVGVYVDDTYMVISCLDGFVYQAPSGVLDEYESFIVHRWLGMYQNYERPNNHGVLIFFGSGSYVADTVEMLSMETLASALEYRAHAYVSGGGMPNAVWVTRYAFSQTIGGIMDDIKVLNFETVNYSDSCLEVPREGEVCSLVTTPGLRIQIIFMGMLYEYHTDFAGYDIRQYGEPQVAPTQGAGG